MRWLMENWIWLVLGGGMVWMHLGHGGMHGNHGGHRTKPSHDHRGHAPRGRSRPEHTEVPDGATPPAALRTVRRSLNDAAVGSKDGAEGRPDS